MKRGLKSYAVCDLLGITKQSLRYWRVNLDPFKQRSEFDGSNILAYRVIETCINKQGITVSELKSNGVKLLFEECTKHHLYLKKLLFVFDKSIHKLDLVDIKNNEIDLYSPDIRAFSMATIVNEHIESMIYFGTTPAKITDITEVKSNNS